MNPFQLSPRGKSEPLAALPDEQETILRVMRLHEELRVLSADLDLSEWASVMIVQSPARLEVASRGTDGNIMPLLAAALMAELERHIVSAEQVKAKLTPEWRDLLLAAGPTAAIDAERGMKTSLSSITL